MTVTDSIIDSIARASGISREDLLSKKRADPIAVARFALYKMLRDRDYALVEISAMCGGRHYSTVIHGLQQYHGRQICKDILAQAEAYLGVRRIGAPEAPDNEGLSETARLAALVAGASREDVQADCNW